MAADPNDYRLLERLDDLIEDIGALRASFAAAEGERPEPVFFELEDAERDLTRSRSQLVRAVALATEAGRGV